MKTFPSHNLACSIVLAGAIALGGCGSESAPSLVAKGQADLANKDFAAAVIRFKAALQSEPDSQPTRILLGKALIEAGDPAGAIVELTRVLSQKGDPSSAVPLIARAHIQAGQFRKLTDTYGNVKLEDKSAEADFKTSIAIAWGAIGNRAKSNEAIKIAVAAAPDGTRTLTTQARLLLLEGSPGAALETVNKALAADPKLVDAWHLKGDVLLAQGAEDTQVEAAFQKALELNPNYVPARAGLVTLRNRVGDLEGAKKQLETLRSIAPKSAETVFLDSQMALLSKDYQKAREGVQQLLKVAPDNVNLLQLAAAVEWQSGSLVIAESLLSAALRSEPTLEQARVNLAHIYLRMGQPVRAMTAIAPMVGVESQKPLALGAAGEASLQLGNLEAAERYFSRAAAAAPEDTRVQTSMAMAQLARGKSASAFAQLESLVSRGRDGYVDAALVTARLQRNEVDAALAAVDALVSKQSDSAMAHELRGRVLLAKKDIPGARQAFEKAASIDPAALAPVNQLAFLDVQEMRPEQAQPRFETYLKRNPGNHMALLSMADLRARMGAPKSELQALLTDAIKAAPSESTARLNLIELLAGQRQIKAALAAAQEAATLLPDDTGVLDALGRMHAADGNAQQALSTFRRITIIDPNASEANIRMAELHKTDGNIGAAIANLRRAVEIDPRSKWARLNFVELLVQQKRSKEALELAREMQRREPQSPGGYLLEGAVLRKLKDNDATIPVYRLGMRKASDKSEIVLNLFTALLASKEAKQAEPLAKEWLAANPQDGAVHYNLGEFYMSNKAYNAAERHFRSALQIRPDFLLALNNLAWVMVKQGKPGAVAVAQQAINLSPNQAEFLDTLSQALEVEGKLPQAIEAQQKAKQITPGDPSVRFRLAQLAIKSGDKQLARSELEFVMGLTSGNPFRDEAAKIIKTL